MERYRLNMTGLALVLGCLVAVLGFAATPARADLYLYFKLDQARMQYTANPDGKGGTATVTPLDSQTASAYLDVKLMDGITVLDSARIVEQKDLRFLLDLKMEQLGENNWSATGNLTMGDTLSANKIVGQFNSTEIFTSEVSQGYVYNLNMKGVLSGTSLGDPLLVSDTDPWVFTGESGVLGLDGGAETVSIWGHENWKNGLLMMFQFDIPVSSPDALFSANRDLQGGLVQGQIVPAPAAVVLGLFGLSAVGWYMRRFA